MSEFQTIGGLDWRDSGKPAEFRKKDGIISRGKLQAADAGFDGEDEYPIWEVELEDGSRHSLWDFEDMRWI
jgi:hypothetical protein